jgi:hypothetical protein
MSITDHMATRNSKGATAKRQQTHALRVASFNLHKRISFAESACVCVCVCVCVCTHTHAQNIGTTKGDYVYSIR